VLIQARVARRCTRAHRVAVAGWSGPFLPSSRGDHAPPLVPGEPELPGQGRVGPVPALPRG